MQSPAQYYGCEDKHRTHYVMVCLTQDNYVHTYVNLALNPLSLSSAFLLSPICLLLDANSYFFLYRVLHEWY